MTNQIADPYAILGIPREADDQEVHDAYRRLAKRYHPDLHPGEPKSEPMRRVNDAWRVLSDPVRRARYDADHPRGATAGSSRPWPPAWTPAATAADGPETGWAASTWSARPTRDPRPIPDVGSMSGPPWAALVAVLIVGWLAIGGVVGGFPLPAVLGILVVIAVGSLLSRFD